jgi:ribosome-binding protein aMBF1 (putative translation factor)
VLQTWCILSVATSDRISSSYTCLHLKARTAKKLTQKDLGTLINEKPQVVAEYESGKAIPNPSIITKLERALGVKLPRPGKAKVPPKDGAATSASSGAKTGVTGKVAALTRGGPPKRK